MLKLRFISIICLVFSFAANIGLAAEWFKEYENGQKAMQQQEWSKAADFFRNALKTNAVDKKKVRTYGMHFIEYYPNRELAICLYNLGNRSEAQRYLKISIDQEPSKRANEYMKQISGGVPPPPAKVEQKKEIVKDDAKEVESLLKETELIVGKQTIKLVGERMGVAILPFENKGASRDLGEIILDKMITVLVNQERFKVMERAQLNKILEEQSLGSSGIIDAATAAQIGKGIGVDAIIIGSVAATVSGSISVDARVIDTESATIIVAQDAYSGSSDAQSVKNAIENLTRKITESLPLVEGYIIRIDGAQFILDVGRVGGLKRGMKCVVYKEGAPIKHPITGEILGKETSIMGEVLVTESFDKYCVAKAILSVAGAISVGDKFLTK
jgi:tetratricopeptide (TPR) repeat protein